MKYIKEYSVIVLSYLIGGGSILLFAVFLLPGVPTFVRLDLNERNLLLFDVGLSAFFFIQHSLMIRKPFRRFICSLIPEAYGSAFYSIASGLALLSVCIFWQKSHTELASANAVIYVSCFALNILVFAGFFWGVKSLKHFDPFGVRQIVYALRGRIHRSMPFTIRGPYHLVRHPLYFLVLVMIWATPVWTIDRIMFNILWTSWIVIGTLMEERDLVAEFGGKYKEYQHMIPMLIPNGVSASRFLEMWRTGFRE